MDVTTQATLGKTSLVKFAKDPRMADRDTAVLVTGTWDSGKSNCLQVWQTEKGCLTDFEEEPQIEIRPLAQHTHEGDVNDLLFLDHTVMLSASSLGSVHVWRLVNNEGTTTILHEFSHSLHTFGPNTPPASCTALAMSPVPGIGSEAASCGEDGRLLIWKVDGGMIAEDIDADPLCINDVAWSGPNQILVASSSGHLRLYDRRDCRKPALTMIDSDNKGTSLHCVTVNQTQANKIATGNSSGHVTVWDIKNASIGMPESRDFHSHNGNVWDVIFHPNDPSSIISCGQDSRICVQNWSRDPNASIYDPSPRYGGTSFGLSQYGKSIRQQQQQQRSQNEFRHLDSMQSRLAMNSVDLHAPSGILVAGNDSGKLSLCLV